MRRNGFSLVELSIVLVILGLLVGGILAGKSLIRASELRAVGTEYQRYIAAVRTFQDKYFALPGDMTNAQDVWGVAHADVPTCATTPSTDSKTCNGNGDGRLLPSGSRNELFRFWQHLANAGLIEGQYDGIAHGGANTSATPVNSPASKLGSAYWFTYYWSTIGSGSGTFYGVYNNSLALGGLIQNNWPYDSIFRPEEAWNIDTKLDDGKPATGKLVIYSMTGISTCADSSNNTDMAASYLLSATTKTCILLFRNLF